MAIFAGIMVPPVAASTASAQTTATQGQLVASTTPAIGLSTRLPARAIAAEGGCGPVEPDLDHRSYDYNFLRSVNLRLGPHWSCAIVHTATINNLVDYHCYDAGDDGTWTYLRTASTRFGWVWDGYLAGGGSLVHC